MQPRNWCTDKLAFPHSDISGHGLLSALCNDCIQEFLAPAKNNAVVPLFWWHLLQFGNNPCDFLAEILKMKYSQMGIGR
nr:E281 [uncultured bacterium]